MDSYGLNKTNTLINFLSGNCFPVKSDTSDHHSTWIKFYMAFTWIVTFSFFVSTSVVLFFIPNEIALQSSTVNTAVSIEGIIIVVYLNVRLPLLRKLMTDLKKILIQNDTLKKAISQTLDPISEPMKIYLVCAISSVTFWNSMAFLRMFNQNEFTYTDFVVPGYLPCEPFGERLFAFGVLLQVTGGFYTITKKTAIDVYVIEIVALLTSQYKYLRNDLASILDGGENRSQTIQEPQVIEEEKKLEERLKTWIKHHQAVLAISQMLKEITTLNVFVTYINCTFRFCFLGYMVIKIPLALFQKCVILMYTGGSVIQLYMLCYSVQELLDASMSVTTKAFNRKWFMRCKSIKKLFRTIMIADEIRSHLSAFGILDLSLPAFTQIINHAYSACLFLQNVD